MFPKAVFAPVGQVSGPLISPEDAMSEDVFLFDLETVTSGTLGYLEHSFADYLRDFTAERTSYLLTRKSYGEISKIIPRSLLQRFTGVFASCGMELWMGGNMISCHEHQFPDDLYEFVVNVVRKSAFFERTPPVIGQGAGCLRICLAGLNCSASRLRAYEIWENNNQELPDIVSEFKLRFPDYTIYQETTTSLLILPNSFSAKSIRDALGKHHRNARMIAYLHTRSAGGYAGPLKGALGRQDVVSVVNGPGDVSQLLSYEIRRHNGQERMIRATHKHLEEV